MRVELRRKAVGEKSLGELVRSSIGEFESRAAAEAFIEGYIEKYAKRGKEGQRDYWWCRNEDDKDNLVLWITW